MELALPGLMTILLCRAERVAEDDIITKYKMMYT